MIDLHTHSNASDGSLSPGDLIAFAAKKGLSTIALTDHDTINGLAEAKNAAQNHNIGFIPGIEVEISMPERANGEFHLLGLGINKPNLAFIDAINMLLKGRDQRNQEIIKRASELNINITYDELLSYSGGKFIGRLHFAKLLIKKKVVKNIEQAFGRFLGKGKPLFIPKPALDFEKGVSIIRESGGLAVLAHPMSLYLAWSKLPDFINKLKSQGLDGIEAWHPSARVQDCKRLEELGHNNGLFITAGSDFHGENRPDRKMGHAAGGKKIERRILEAIPLLAERLR